MDGQKRNGKLPRYIELANQLRDEIFRGKYTIAGDFPTEAALCKKFGISRYTVREALRKLCLEGLISRKRGSGTVVHSADKSTSKLREPAFRVPDLLQHRDDSYFSFEAIGAHPIPDNVTRQAETKHQGRWFAFLGRRVPLGSKKAVAVTRIWINPAFADVVGKLNLRGTNLFRQLEIHAKLNITRVSQQIKAVAAPQQSAKELGMDEGDPVLNIQRCYFDQNHRMIEISSSYHPAEKFVYSMQIDID